MLTYFATIDVATTTRHGVRVRRPRAVRQADCARGRRQNAEHLRRWHRAAPRHQGRVSRFDLSLPGVGVTCHTLARPSRISRHSPTWNWRDTGAGLTPKKTGKHEPRSCKRAREQNCGKWMARGPHRGTLHAGLSRLRWLRVFWALVMFFFGFVLTPKDILLSRSSSSCFSL